MPREKVRELKKKNKKSHGICYQGGHCPGNQGKVRESEKRLKVREKSVNLNRLSESKCSAIP